jgi:WD40 repeat protein
MLVEWDLQKPGDGQLIAQFPNSVYSLLHLAEKNILVAGQNFSGIHLIDHRNKKEVASMQITSAYIFDIQAFQQDLIIATGDGSIVIVDAEQWVVKKRVTVANKSARAIAIHAEGGEMAVGFSDHCIRIFSLGDYELKQEIKGHRNSVFALTYSRDGKFLFSGARDARLMVWDVNAQYRLGEEVAAHLYAINHLALSPDAKYLASASMDKSIKVWDTQNLRLLKVIDKGRHAGHGTSVNKLLWTSFNNQLLSASDDRTISAWDLLFL